MSKNRSQWLELTDKQIALAMLAVDDPLQWGRLGPDNVPMLRKFARAIEAEVRSLRSQDNKPVATLHVQRERHDCEENARENPEGWLSYSVSQNVGVTSLELPEGKYPLFLASPPSQPIASDVVAAPDALSQVPQDEFSGIARQRMQREFARTDHIVAGIARRRDETSGDPT